MKITKETESLSCNNCNRCKLNKSGYSLEYPYDFVWVLRFNSTSIKLCNDCLIKLFDQISQTLSSKKGCGKIYNNMLGEKVECGTRKYDKKGIHQRLCEECSKKEE